MQSDIVDRCIGRPDFQGSAAWLAGPDDRGAWPGEWMIHVTATVAARADDLDAIDVGQNNCLADLDITRQVDGKAIVEACVDCRLQAANFVCVVYVHLLEGPLCGCYREFFESLIDGRLGHSQLLRRRLLLKVVIEQGVNHFLETAIL